jgi:hypothetical protein
MRLERPTAVLEVKRGFAWLVYNRGPLRMKYAV